MKTQIIDVLARGITLGCYRFIPMMPSKTSELPFGRVYQSFKSLSLSHRIPIQITMRKRQLCVKQRRKESDLGPPNL